MIWGFEDILEIPSGDINRMDVMNLFQKRINLWKKNSNDVAAVGYFSYDAKQLFFPKIKFKPIFVIAPIPRLIATQVDCSLIKTPGSWIKYIP